MAESKATCTIIGPTIAIRGKVRAGEDLMIRGRIDAAIASTRLVHIDTNGVVKADIEAQSLIVSGVVVGNITATARAELTATARVVGDISAPLLIIHDGARLRGNIDMPDVDAAMEAEYVAPPPAARQPERAAVPAAAPRAGSSPVITSAGSAAQGARPRNPVRAMPLKAGAPGGAALPGVRQAGADAMSELPSEMDIEEVEITETPELLAVYDDVEDLDSAEQTAVVPPPVEAQGRSSSSKTSRPAVIVGRSTK